MKKTFKFFGFIAIVAVIGFSMAGCDWLLEEAPKITTSSLPDGVRLADYSQKLQASGTTPITWSLDKGSLPAGLMLAGGTITGFPTTAGTSTFTVKATNSAGSDARELKITINSGTGGGTVPGIPTGVTAVRDSTTPTTIRVSWTSVSGATGYKVYSATANGASGVLEASPTTTSYDSLDNHVDRTFYFQVSAVNSVGEGTRSAYVMVGPASGTAPATPTGVTATAASSTSITVSWTAVPGATGYTVYRSSSSGGTYSSVGTPTTTSYTDTGLTASTAYYYQVTAKNATGESSRSTTASATTSAGGWQGSHTRTITTTAQWNAALADLNGQTGDDFILTISGNVSVPGFNPTPTEEGNNMSNGSFGVTAAGSSLTVTLNGNGKLSLSGQGNLIRVGGNQTLVLDSPNLTLEGRAGNNKAVVQVHTAYNANLEVVGGGTFTMNSGKITGNTTTGDGGGVHMAGRTTFTMTGGEISGNTTSETGGGVYMASSGYPSVGGVFTMSGGKITGNTARSGGGVNLSRGTFTMTSGEISDNTGGTGVSVGNYGTFTMTGGKITGNKPPAGSTNVGHGGGVSVSGTFTMDDGEISGNSAIAGGGVYVSGTFTMNDGEISGNTATSDGGGVYVTYDTATFTLKGGKISGNEALGGAINNGGGGVCVTDGGTFIMLDGKIYGNNAISTGGGVYAGSGATDGAGIFQIVKGTIYGSDEDGTDDDDNDLKNTATSADGFAALRVAGGTAERGTFTGPNDGWVKKDDLVSTNDTITVLNGD